MNNIVRKPYHLKAKIKVQINLTKVNKSHRSNAKTSLEVMSCNKSKHLSGPTLTLSVKNTRITSTINLRRKRILWICKESLLLSTGSYTVKPSADSSINYKVQIGLVSKHNQNKNANRIENKSSLLAVAASSTFLCCSSAKNYKITNANSKDNCMRSCNKAKNTTPKDKSKPMSLLIKLISMDCYTGPIRPVCTISPNTRGKYSEWLCMIINTIILK